MYVYSSQSANKYQIIFICLFSYAHLQLVNTKNILFIGITTFDNFVFKHW
jgi:hypothetical protein